MAEQLLPGIILNNRYKIKKVVTSEENHNVYLAQDIKVTETIWVVKEYIFPLDKGLSEEELNLRETAYCETLDVITNFEYKGLPGILDFFQEAGRQYVVMENIEGVTLKALSEMSVEMFQERQIIEWALGIAEALLYLHSRPKPFIHSELDPAHIMLDAENNVKLVNLGLKRFFDPSKDFKAFTTSFVDLTDDFFELGKTLYFLFTRKEYDPHIFSIDLPQSSDQMLKIVSRCLSDDPSRNYRDVRDLINDLNKVLHPKATNEEKTDTAITRPYIYRYLHSARENLDKVIFAILSQKISYFIAEIIGLMALSFIIWLFLTPGWNYTKKGPLMMVACRNELLTLDTASRKLLDRKEVPGGYSDIAPAKNGAYLSSTDRSRIDIIDTLHNTVNGSITVARSPSKMLRSGSVLFCVNEPSCNISVVSADQNKMISMISTCERPDDIAYSADRNRLFISCSSINYLQIVDPIGNFNRGFFKVRGGVGALAIDPEENFLYIVSSQFYGLQRFDMESKKVVETYYGLGFSKVSAMQFGPQGKNLYILDNEKFQLVVFSPSQKKVLYTLKVMKNPVAMAFEENSRLWIVNSGSHTISVVNLASQYVEATIETARNPCAIRYFR
ncbi:MAG: protein kinase [Vulcanimicrobiota bacterium]